MIEYLHIFSFSSPIDIKTSLLLIAPSAVLSYNIWGIFNLVVYRWCTARVSTYLYCSHVQTTPFFPSNTLKHCLPVVYNAVICNWGAPLPFGDVCRYWRRLAPDLAELWIFINIVIPPISVLSAASLQKTATLPYISAWLSRSGVLRLSSPNYDLS